MAWIFRVFFNDVSEAISTFCFILVEAETRCTASTVHFLVWTERKEVVSASPGGGSAKEANALHSNPKTDLHYQPLALKSGSGVSSTFYVIDVNIRLEV